MATKIGFRVIFSLFLLTVAVQGRYFGASEQDLDLPQQLPPASSSLVDQDTFDIDGNSLNGVPISVLEGNSFLQPPIDEEVRPGF